jgi:hypothetical protein
MYSRFTIQTRLSVVEAERVLEGLVQPKRFFLDPDPATPDRRPFAGRIDGGAFKFQRVITGRNSFLPIIVGRVTPGEGGAVIRGHMRLAIPVAVVMTGFMGATLTAAFNGLPRELASHNIRAACVFAFLPLFGALLIGIGYYPEKHKAMRLLVDAFEQNRVVG